MLVDLSDLFHRFWHNLMRSLVAHRGSHVRSRVHTTMSLLPGGAKLTPEERVSIESHFGLVSVLLVVFGFGVGETTQPYSQSSM